MAKRFKKVFKMFWAWNDDQEEKWLREMSQKGWQLRHYNLLYTFEKAEPKDCIYKLDYKASMRGDMEEYLQIFEDAGWEHAAQFGGWHYFKAEAGKTNLPDIYSDLHYKIEKYRRVLGFLLVIFVSLLTISLTIVFNPHNNAYESTGMRVLRLVYIGIFLLYIYFFTRIILKMKRLKDEDRK